MMSLLLRQISDMVHESQRRFEIWKLVNAREMVLVDHSPVRELVLQVCELGSLERRDAAPAGKTVLVGERCHEGCLTQQHTLAIIEHTASSLVPKQNVLRLPPVFVCLWIS